MSPSVVSDGLSTTGWTLVPASAQPESFDLQLNKRAALTDLSLTIYGTPSGAFTVEALRNGSWVSASAPDLNLASSTSVSIVGSTYTIPLDDTASDALRLVVANTSGTGFQITEVQVTGSGTSGAYDPASLTVNWPQNGEFYGRTAFLRGFVLPEANLSGAADLYVAGYPAAINNGTFEVATSKDQAGFAAQADADDWTVDVSAVYPDGTVVSHQVVLNNSIVDENIAAYAPQRFSQLFIAGQDTTVAHEEAELTVAAAALAQDSVIRITPLRGIELAKLDAGLINVTKGPRAGYRLLSHQKFNANVSLKLPFNANRIPRGYTENDVRLYYFDEDAGRWVALSENAIDAGTGHVTGKTKHFTDFIAGVVVAPESPQVASFNPTQLKDIKVADPSAKINLISVPKGSNTGDASLSYPIELPPGRLGMAPQLGLQYSSGAQNGWMGVGWNISMQEISIDTRWGVPRYDDADETETYVIAGQQLTPVAHRGVLVTRVAEREFHQRIEGSFNKIVRHGDNPDNYWWEVTDKMGTRYAYGGDLDSGAQDASAILADDAGNVYKWALTETRDTNGNRVTYDYLTVATPGLKLGTLAGRNLYCDTIRYTGHGATDGPFEVRFIRDRQQPAFTERTDTIIDGRGGFKMVTADLLKRVEVSYLGAQVRAYEFDYVEGAFHKTLLQSVRQMDATDAAFNTHTFEYFDDARTARVYKGFAGAADWNSPNDNVDLDAFGVVHQDASALSGSEGSGVGGHLYVGLGFGGGKQTSIGAKLGTSSGQSNGRLALVDLNGDGLPDKTYFGANGIYYRANISGANGTLEFSPTLVLIATLREISHDRSIMSSRGVEAYFGLSAGINWSDSLVVADVYFSDVNGDGLPDLVRDGAVLFNHLDGSGVPTFTADSSLTPYPIGSAAVDAAVLSMNFDTLYQDMIDNAPLVDAVRAWTAPFAGTVSLAGNVALVEDTSPERAAYTTADGVRVAIEHGGISLWSLEIAETDYAAKTPTVGSLSVAKGDVIYFRVQSLFDGAYDEVLWNPLVSYVAAPVALDANGRDQHTYTASSDFALASGAMATAAAPFDGTVRVMGTFDKPVQTTDDITIEVLKNGSVVSTQSLAWNATGSIPVSADLSLAKIVRDVNGVVITPADVVGLRMRVDSQIDLAGIGRSASSPAQVIYIASTDPNLPQVNNGAGDPNVNISLAVSPDTYSQANFTAASVPWTSTEDGLFSLLPQIILSGGSTLTGDIVATVKSGGQQIAKAVIPVTAGAMTPSSFGFTAVLGQDYYIEYSSNVPGSINEIVSANMELTSPTSVISTIAVPFFASYNGMLIQEAYRSWSVLGYNGNRTRADLPIDLSDANLSMTQAEIDAAMLDLQASIDAGVRDDAVLASHEQIVFLMQANGEVNRWDGSDENVWIASSGASSSRQGEDFISVPDVSIFAGATGISRVSVAETFAVNAGALGVSAQVSDSTRRSELDYMDLNG